MEKLLRLASQQADQADVYYVEESQDSVGFVDGKLDKADSVLSFGIALRVIKNGRAGLAHTRNLLDRQALVDQALASAGNGMEVNIRLPLTQDLPQLPTYDPAIEKVTKAELIAEGKRLVDYVKQHGEGQFNLDYEYSSGGIGLLNSAGTDLSLRASSFVVYGQMVFPGTGAGLFDFKTGRTRVPLDEAQLDALLELFRLGQTEIVPQTGKMPVIFAQYAPFALISRFNVAASPVNFYNKVSSLIGKYGQPIFSEKISIRQDPFDVEMGSCMAFDGEGTPTRAYSFVDKGVFKAIPTDLNYAQKLGLEPTGNGFRGNHENQPSAQPVNVVIEPGDKTLPEMIASLDTGLIVYSLMGAHSGNILNGDYSVGVGTGFYVEKGRIKGRVKDCLLTGNAYETLSKVGAVESSCCNLGSYKIPAILCEEVSVTGK